MIIIQTDDATSKLEYGKVPFRCVKVSGRYMAISIKNCPVIKYQELGMLHCRHTTNMVMCIAPYIDGALLIEHLPESVTVPDDLLELADASYLFRHLEKDNLPFYKGRCNLVISTWVPITATTQESRG